MEWKKFTEEMPNYESGILIVRCEDKLYVGRAYFIEEYKINGEKERYYTLSLPTFSTSSIKIDPKMEWCFPVNINLVAKEKKSKKIETNFASVIEEENN